MYRHHILDQFFLFEVYFTKNEKLECMEYICDKIIHVIEFEKIAYIFQNQGCEWNSWVNFFMVYDIDIHELNLGPFRDLKFFG